MSEVFFGHEIKVQDFTEFNKLSDFELMTAGKVTWKGVSYDIHWSPPDKEGKQSFSVSDGKEGFVSKACNSIRHLLSKSVHYATCGYLGSRSQNAVEAALKGQIHSRTSDEFFKKITSYDFFLLDETDVNSDQFNHLCQRHVDALMTHYGNVDVRLNRAEYLEKLEKSQQAALELNLPDAIDLGIEDQSPKYKSVQGEDKQSMVMGEGNFRDLSEQPYDFPTYSMLLEKDKDRSNYRDLKPLVQYPSFESMPVFEKYERKIFKGEDYQPSKGFEEKIGGDYKKLDIKSTHELGNNLKPLLQKHSFEKGLELKAYDYSLPKEVNGLQNVCPEVALLRCAELLKVEPPKFNYSKAAHDVQVDIISPVQMKHVLDDKMEKDIAIRAKGLEAEQLGNQIVAALEGHKDTLYLGRKGYEGGAGLFFVLRFDENEGQWLVYDDQGEPKALKDDTFVGSAKTKYGVCLVPLAQENLQPLANIIVECREENKIGSDQLI